MNAPEPKAYPIGHPIIKQLIADHLTSPGRAGESQQEKIALIEAHFREIMLVLGLDLEDDSLKDSPARVARMYVQETFSGLFAENEPDIALFDNAYRYSEMLIEKNIPVYSTCEHHFLPIIGKAHIGYIPNGKVAGLSKLNRVVHYFSKRPQVQERLTVQIAAYLKKVLHTEDVAVLIEASHLCVASRGVRDPGGSTISSSYHGQFINTQKRKEFNRQLSQAAGV